MTDRLRGKTALITGAASGIGRASALLFAAEGARIVACDINADGGEDVAQADIANVALFLASDESRMVSAPTIVADGGLSSH
jgi:3(or 17)beta-hydroxysteroid dehydrogenase